VTVPAGTNAPLAGAFRYAAVSNLILTAQTEYVIGGSDFYGQDADIYPWKPEAFSTARGVSFLGPRESEDELPGLLFPNDEYHPGAPLAVNFQFIPVPRLIVWRAVPSGVELSWTTNASQWHLEYAESLPATIWNAVTNVPTVVEGNFVVPLPSTGGQRYFRLSNQ
jgi:hypothetical protein